MNHSIINPKTVRIMMIEVISVITIQNKQMMIEHYQRVIHVTSDEIKLDLKEHPLVIYGKNLQILALSKDEVLIEGQIEGLLFQHEN